NFTLTPAPAIQAYAAGQRFRVQFNAAGTTGSNTLNISGQGAKNLMQYGPDGVLVPAAITNSLLSDVEYNGTNMVVLDPIATGFSAVQPLAASVASNALTLTLNPTALSFRSATLTSGAALPASIGTALSITVPSGATLGTTSGVQATLALLVAYNGGSPVLCVANIAGGSLNLDETGLISPATISGSSNSTGTIYAASTVSANSPYRVVGFVNVTESTAGTWATAPSLVQGMGGMNIADLLGACSVFGSAVVSSGYQKLPSGLFLQWGNYAAANGVVSSVTFPIAFTTSCFQTFGVINNSASAGAVSSAGATTTTASFFQSLGTSQNVSWFAIGK
ncbi:MAG: hypothetical protein RXR52_31570, partial [Paraburkholderia sp.]|uniref:gp53-like domain-containing protein n=1 Tax=Paraburkholderia sp. TaxID=1926495 RepID=UPI00397AC76E